MTCTLPDDTQLKRLRWRCRRGTAELDALLGGWLLHDYEHAVEPIRSAFADMLELQDPQLWAWLTAQEIPPRAEWRQIIDEIRARSRR